MFCLVSSQANAQLGASKGSLDGLINWDNPWNLTPEKFKEVAEALPKKKTERAYNTRLLSDGRVSYSIGKTPGSFSGGGKMNLFNGELQVDSVTVLFEADKAVSISLSMGESSGPKARKVSLKEVVKLQAGLAKATGDTAPKPYNQDAGRGRSPVVIQQWTHRNYMVQMFELQRTSASGESSGMGVFNVRVLPLESK